MERSFKEEVEKLKLTDGDVFHGEAILAVTKALLQSGVSYVGGYQGAPVSHVMDVLNDARGILEELGVHVDRRHQRRLRRPVQPRLRRRQGWGDDRARRGLWRRRLDHPGAQPRLR